MKGKGHFAAGGVAHAGSFTAGGVAHASSFAAQLDAVLDWARGLTVKQSRQTCTSCVHTMTSRAWDWSVTSPSWPQKAISTE